MSLPFMRALLDHDIATAEAEIGVPVPPGLADELDGFLQYRIADLTVDPEAQPWLGRAVVLREDGGRGSSGRSGSTPRRTRTGGSRWAIAWTRRTGGPASPPRSSGRCSTGPRASTA